MTSMHRNDSAQVVLITA